LKVLVKSLLNLISFPPILPNFGGMKIWGLKKIKRNEYSLLPIPFPATQTPKQGNGLSIPSIKNLKQGKGRIL